MKKTFALLILGLALAACNGPGTGKSTDSAAPGTGSDTGKMNDSSKMKSDSMVNQAADTLKAH